MDTQKVLAKGVLQTTALYRHAAVTLAELVKYVVDAFTTMLAHHAWTDVPLPHEGDNVVLQVVQLWEDRVGRTKCAICRHEVSDVSFCEAANNDSLDFLQTRYVSVQAYMVFFLTHCVYLCTCEHFACVVCPVTLAELLEQRSVLLLDCCCPCTDSTGRLSLGRNSHS